MHTLHVVCWSYTLTFHLISFHLISYHYQCIHAFSHNQRSPRRSLIDYCLLISTHTHTPMQTRKRTPFIKYYHYFHMHSNKYAVESRWKHFSVYVSVCVCLCTHVYVCMCMCMCTHTHAHTVSRQIIDAELYYVYIIKRENHSSYMPWPVYTFWCFWSKKLHHPCWGDP